MTSSNGHVMKNNSMRIQAICSQRNDHFNLSLLLDFFSFMRILQSPMKIVYPHWTLY